jgi:flavin-dependent dehydrogenase
MLRCGLQEAGSICRGNILAIGETIGATFPFTGEGIGKAMETAEIAAEVSHKALTRGNTECMKEYRPRIETPVERFCRSQNHKKRLP